MYIYEISNSNNIATVQLPRQAIPSEVHVGAWVALLLVLLGITFAAAAVWLLVHG